MDCPNRHTKFSLSHAVSEGDMVEFFTIIKVIAVTLCTASNSTY